MTTKRQALGRGLAALIPSATTASTTNDPGAPASLGAAIHAQGAGAGAAAASPRPISAGREGLRIVGIEELHPSPSQPRKAFDDEKLNELATSIRNQGLIQPLVVRNRDSGGGGYEIIAGERRWRAAQRAGLHTIPVVVREVAPDRAFELAMVENLQREDLNPIEEAEGFERLIQDFEYTQESLAARIGKNRSSVANALRLLKLPLAVRGLVIEGRLSMGHARAILGIESTGESPGEAAEAMERMARRVVSRDMSVRQVEDLVRKEKGRGHGDGDRHRHDQANGTVDGVGASGAPQQLGPGASARDLGARLSRAFSTRVRVVETGAGTGHVEIHYGSLDQLDGAAGKIVGRRRIAEAESEDEARARAKMSNSDTVPVLELHYRSIGTFLVAYASRLAKGEIFLETATPWPLSTPMKLRLHVPACPPMDLAGKVAWTRPGPIGPGQPAGMGIALVAAIDVYGERIDQMAARYTRIRILVSTADPAGGAVIGRYLQSLLACEIVDWDAHRTPSSRLDLALIDFDAPAAAVGSMLAHLRNPASVEETRGLDDGAPSEPNQNLRGLSERRGPRAEAGMMPPPVLLLAQSERARSRAAALEVDDVLPNPPSLPELHCAVLHALSRPARWVRT